MFGYVSHPPKTARDVSQKCVLFAHVWLLLTRIMDPETWNGRSSSQLKNQVLGICKIRNNLLGSKISPAKALLKMRSLFSGWDMLVPWRVVFWSYGSVIVDTHCHLSLQAFEQQTPEGRELLSILAANAAQMCAESCRHVTAVRVRLKGGTGSLMVSFVLKHLNSLLMKRLSCCLSLSLGKYSNSATVSGQIIQGIIRSRSKWVVERTWLFR